MDAIDHAYAEVAAEEANQAPAPGTYIFSLLFVMIVLILRACDMIVIYM